MSQGPFGLENADFWAEPFKNAGAVANERRVKRAHGIFIDAPAAVHLDLNGTVPLIGGTFLSLREAAALLFEQTAVVVAVRLEDGAVLVSRATLPEWDADAEPPEPGDPGDGLVFETFELDLRNRLSLPKKRGTYLVTVLAREWISNRVRVLVRPSSKGYDDPAVVEFARKRRAQQAPPAPFPAPAANGGLPSYAKRADSPSLPHGVGISLDVERVALVDEGGSLVLRASFRLPVRANERRKDATPGRPTAVLPISLVLAGAEEPGPFLLPLRVESHAPIDDKGHATGHFSLDLFALSEMPRIPQTYFVYAFAGETMAGPIPMALVTESIRGTLA